MRQISGKQNILLSWSTVSLALALAAGCAPSMDAVGDSQSATAVSSDNGLRTINGLRGRNGLQVDNGLTLSNGLASPAGLSSTTGLMTTAEGRTTVAYLVRCALPATRSITKADQTGANFKFTGGIGLAPEWETGACGSNCQMWISACMLSMINTTGAHYPVWMVGQNAGLGWGQDPTYSKHEGSFFGNLFTSPPSAYYCGGRDFGVNPIPGRIGSAQGTVPYANIYGAGGRCSSYCTAADYPNANDGVKACSGWNQIVTIWHQ